MGTENPDLDQLRREVGLPVDGQPSFRQFAEEHTVRPPALYAAIPLDDAVDVEFPPTAEQILDDDFMNTYGRDPDEYI